MSQADFLVEEPVEIQVPLEKSKTDSKYLAALKLGGYYSIGRRKASVAKVRVVVGTGKIIINKRRADEYLQFNIRYMDDIRSPLVLIGLKDNHFDIHVQTHGGGIRGQVGAIKFGLARFISVVSGFVSELRWDEVMCAPGVEPRDFPDFVHERLRSRGFLTRDSRVKERKKYGLKKARKAPQFSKR
jgi:small subunit ribosomal protein S9